LARSEPIFNAPRVVLGVLAMLIAVHVAREYLIDSESDHWLVLTMAFIPARFSGEELPGGEIAKLTSFLSHAVLHGDFTHLTVNCGWLLAFGTIVARRIDAIRFILLLAISAVAGAMLFLALNWGLLQPMVGASGAISGMMGAAIRFMFQPRTPKWRGVGRQLAPAMTLSQLARDPRSRMMIGSWLALNLLFGLFLGKVITTGGIAWEAHLGGFFAGLLAFPWFDSAAGAAVQFVEDHDPTEY